MAHASLPVSRGYLFAGALIAAGLYATRDRAEPAVHAEPTVISVEPGPALSSPPPPSLFAVSSLDLAHEPDASAGDLEQVRGHAPITDAAEFAMVFEVDGTSYLRLSSGLRATSRGKARMFVDGGVHAVVAPVAASALPGELAAWKGRTVLVNGTCAARVVGFAEVSRAAGDPPGTDEYWSTPDDERPAKQPAWTLEDVVADEVSLAAELDGCSGTWARSADYQPAQVARATTAPSLEAHALADLLAIDDNLDPLQDEWTQMGGEGNWRDAVELAALTYEHPATGETWIFASAYKEGSCGDPYASKMAAYRVGASGAVQRFADLTLAGAAIQDVVDLDGDGQPELVVGAGSSTTLVDLANTMHDSISVAYHHYGCGC